MNLSTDILGRVRFWSEVSPEQLAHVSRKGELTYGELEQRSNAFADYLSCVLADNHAPVAIIGHKEPEMLVAFLGSVKAGHPYIPMDDSLPSQRIETIVKESKSAICLTAAQVAEILTKAPAAEPRQYSIDPLAPWYIIFTSGSTGAPKGVVITASCLESFVKWMLNEQGFTNQEEVFLNQAPFSFDLSVMDLYLSLATGGTLYSISRDEIGNPKELFLSLTHSEVTVWVSTPSFAQMCLIEPTFSESMLPRLHKFLFCGEILPPEVAQELKRRFPKAEVWNTYGPTEATCATTSVKITEEILSHYNPLPVGFPKPDSRIWLIEPEKMSTVSAGRGEIAIAGPNVSVGYLENPELTEKAFFQAEGQRTYHTGDWGHFHDGMLFFDGRIDNQIKLHGYRIELGDIEANLLALPEVLDAVVVPHLKNGVPDSLAAFILLKTGTDAKGAETARLLKHELSQRLPAYMLPRTFRFLDRFPMTPNGKADRRQLAESLK